MMPPPPADKLPATAPEADPRDITQGSIGRHLWRLAVPGALTNLMTFSATLVDMIWLGRISPAAIAAVTTFQYIWFLFSLLNQSVGAGSVTLIARSYGAKNMPTCRRMIGRTFSFKLIVAAVSATLGLALQGWAYWVFGARDEVLSMALTYGTIMFAATPLMFSTFTLKTGLRAIGDVRRLFWVSFFTMLINLVLDPFLIFERVHIPAPAWSGMTDNLIDLPGFGLGVAGAAWATVIAFAIIFTTLLVMFTRGITFIRVPLRRFFDFNRETARKILKIGIPPAIGNSLAHIASMVVGAAIMTYGTPVFAGQGVNRMAVRLIRMSTFGLNMAVSTLVGQNLGAKNPARALRSVRLAYVAGAVMYLALGAAFYFGAGGVARLFIPGTDPESLEAYAWAVKILRINCFLFLPFALTRVASGAFEGSGHTKPAMYGMAIGTWGVQVPLTLLGVYFMQLKDPLFIWWIEVAGYSAAALVLYLVYRRGTWLTKKV